MADLFHLPYGTLIQSIGLGSVFEKYPTVKKWFEDLQARESWKKAGPPAAGKPTGRQNTDEKSGLTEQTKEIPAAVRA